MHVVLPNRLLVLLAPLAALACGEDKGPGEAGPVESGLAAPPEGSERATLKMDSFELEPGGEAYRCQAFENPFGRDVAILQSQASISPGSHHLLVFSIDESAAAPLEECSGLEFHPTLHVAQTPLSQTTYPPGVGMSFQGAKGIRLNAHYLNTTDHTIRPSIEVVLDAVSPSDVSQLAASIILNDSTINVPPRAAGVAGGSLSLPPEVGSVKLLRIQSHMHRHSLHFQAAVDGAAPLYETNSWDEPPVKVFSPEMNLASGATLTWKCQIKNDSDTALTFGESAATNEMCTTTGYYYPAPGGAGLIGDVVLGKIGLAK